MKFLTPQDVIDNPNAKLEITGVGELIVSEKFGNERLHIPCKFLNEDVMFDCSKVNARTIQDVIGANTDKLIGAKFILETYRTKNVKEEMIDAINIKEVIVMTPG